MKKIICFTDGACSNNPGPGGYGIVFLKNINDEKPVCMYFGGSDYTTNNRMELTGVIESIKLAIKNNYDEIEIHSDSAYVVNAFLKGWIGKWEKNNWTTSQNLQVKNKDLWLKFIECSQNKIKINFNKVSGHSNVKYNELADKLAVEACNKISNDEIQIGVVQVVGGKQN